MFTTSWKLTLLALVVVLVISVAVRQFGRYLRELSHKTQAAAAVAASIAEKVVGLFSGGLNAASTLSTAVVVIYGANLAINGAMTTGALTSFILYSLTVGTAVSGVSGLYSAAMKATGASRRVFQLLDRVSSMSKSGEKCPFGDQDGEVEINDIWFTYLSRPSHMVLKRITLKLTPGSKVALVGPSGGGKVKHLSILSFSQKEFQLLLWAPG
ncbi:hypothetical protein MKX01_023509 [Papaver californicum]|nr:hypothetical protein MKX01_023509 [Papaver californicum]